MGDTAEVNIGDTQRTYFSFKYTISYCTYCRGLPSTPITPYLFKIDNNAVWQLLMQNKVIFLKLIKSQYGSSQVDVRTSYLPATYSKSGLTHCNLINEVIGISGSLKLHTFNNSCLCSHGCQSYISTIEILCELFIHPQKNKSDLKFLSKDFKCLLHKETLSDVTLVTNQHEFQVHKAVLSARSSVFNAMFHSGMKETKENKVVIKDIDAKVMNQILLYIYTGRINTQIVKNIAENIIIAADKYALERLKFNCGLVLSSNLTAENIFYNSSLAERYELQHLKKAIVQFMTNSQDKIIANIPNTVDDSPESSEKEEVDLE